MLLFKFQFQSNTISILFPFQIPIYVLAPNVYRIPTVLGSSNYVRSAPSFSVTGKIKSKLPENRNFPSPGSYDARYDFVKPKPPVFSMGSRYNVPTDAALKPGPGAYRPEKLNLGHIPCYSFGKWKNTG